MRSPSPKVCSDSRWHKGRPFGYLFSKGRLDDGSLTCLEVAGGEVEENGFDDRFSPQEPGRENHQRYIGVLVNTMLNAGFPLLSQIKAQQ